MKNPNYPNRPFDDSDEAMHSLREIKEAIRALKETVIEAETSTDEERRNAIKKAIRLACRLMTDLWEGLDSLIDRTLNAVGVEAEAEPAVTFGVLIDSNDEWKNLSDKKTFRRLLQAAASVAPFQDSPAGAESVRSLVDEVADSFEKLKNQPLSTKEVLTQIGRVRSVVCRPPFDEDGERNTDDKPPPERGPGGLRRFADDVARIVALLTAWAYLNGAPIEPPPKVPHPPPHSDPAPLTILAALLLFCFVADDLIDRGMISAEREILTLDGDGRYSYAPAELVVMHA